MPLWAEYSMSEWLRAQLVAGLRRGPEYPIPPIDHPGCANGTVSRRHWLTWQQANSVSVFEIQLLRDIVAILARAGIEPVNSWLTQQTHTAAIGGHKALLEATGDPNGDAAPNWPLHDERDWHLDLDVESRMGARLRKDPCDLWDSIPGP